MPVAQQAPPATPPVVKPVASHPSMSGKLRRGARALRRFLILRGDKLALVGGIAGFVVFFVIAVRHLPYGKSPSDLKSQVDKVLRDIESAKPSGKQTKGLAKAPDLKSLEAVAGRAIPQRAYHLAPWQTPYADHELRRGEPKVLPVEGLLASAGYGPIAIKGAVAAKPTAPPTSTKEEKPSPASDAQQRLQRLQEMKRKLAEERARARGGVRPRSAPKPKEEPKPEEPQVVKEEPKEKPLLDSVPKDAHLEYRNWVCLVGAVPYERQIGEHQRAFESALYQSPDRDSPRYALPQIERAEVIGNRRLRWQPLPVISALEDHASWAAEYPEWLDARLIDPDHTEQLPPLVLANFDPAKVSHPQVKVMAIKRSKLASVAEPHANVGPQQAAESKKPQPIFGLRDKKVAEPAAPPPAEAKKNADKPKEEAEPAEERIVYRLFRFFDFEVEPGKTYSYRVKLVALNPNYELPARLLERSESAEELLLEAKWSMPTRPVSLVDGTRLVAGGISFGEAENGQPESMVQVLVRFFDFATAKRASALFDTPRGGVLNQPGVAIQSTEEPPKQEKKPGKGDKTKPAEIATLDINTDAVVVDFFGGNELAGKKGSKVPSHILVVDQFGGFKALVEANDAPTFGADLPAAQQAGNPAAGSEQARK